MSGSEPMDHRDMLIWARGVIASREPDFVIGDNYLRRWWIVPRNEYSNTYLHEINRSDDDRAMHDHPWDNTSIVLDGTYVEITPFGNFTRKAGDVVRREATDIHRLVIPEGGSAITLFVTGPVRRTWGFHCPNGFVPWYDFVDQRDKGQPGRGCGEMA